MNLQQDPMLYDFNQIYKEMDDLYHAVAKETAAFRQRL